MKKILLAIAVFLSLGVLAFGAVKLVVIDPKTVSSAKELLDKFYETRSSIPPLPSPVSYEEVINQLAEGRVDFIAHSSWAYAHDAGTYYLADDSSLAKKLSLPMQLIAYEDLLSGTVVLAGTSEAFEGLQVLAKVKAPLFSSYDEETSFESYLMWELGPRRIIWSAILKQEEDAWADLVAIEQAAALSVVPMMMAMSMPVVVTNLTLEVESESNAVDVALYFPSGYTNFVDIFSCTSLTDWDWSLFTNVSSIGLSEVNWTDSVENHSSHFWVAMRSDLDSDGDGISDSHEVYLYSADPNVVDTDGDGLDDGAEIAGGTNPLVPDSDGDGLRDNIENALAGSISINGSEGVLLVVPDTGWYHMTVPDQDLFYLGSE